MIMHSFWFPELDFEIVLLYLLPRLWLNHSYRTVIFSGVDQIQGISLLAVSSNVYINATPIMACF